MFLLEIGVDADEDGEGIVGASPRSRTRKPQIRQGYSLFSMERPEGRASALPTPSPDLPHLPLPPPIQRSKRTDGQLRSPIGRPNPTNTYRGINPPPIQPFALLPRRRQGHQRRGQWRIGRGNLKSPFFEINLKSPLSRQCLLWEGARRV